MATVLCTLTTNKTGGTHLTISSNSEQAAKSSWVFLLLFPRIFLLSISGLSESSNIFYGLSSKLLICESFPHLEEETTCNKRQSSETKTFWGIVSDVPCVWVWLGGSPSQPQMMDNCWYFLWLVHQLVNPCKHKMKLKIRGKKSTQLKCIFSTFLGIFTVFKIHE